MNLRVMTFNIRNGLANDGLNSWENRKHVTTKVIIDASPDVIGLQEVYDFQLSFLLESLPDYACYSVGREDGISQGEHCSILWRKDLLTRSKAGTYWLSDAPDVPNSMGWGNRITRICSWVEFTEGLSFYNTHWDHESAPAREKSVALIVDALPSTPWILVGDLNAEPGSNEITQLAAACQGSFITATNEFGTFHNYEGGSDGDLIDHIFVSPEIRVRQVEVLTLSDGLLFPSDHYPVLADLAL